MFVNFHVSVAVIVFLLAKSRAQDMDQNMDQCRPPASPRLAQWSLRSLALRGREIG